MRAPFVTPFLLAGDPAFENEEHRLAIYAQVFGTVNGRMVLADILVRSGIGVPAYQPASGADAFLVGYYSGVHATALGIANDAGLSLQKMGRALIEGSLESMMESDEHDDGNDDE